MDWAGYGPEDFSWEDAENVHAPHLTHQFHTKSHSNSDLGRRAIQGSSAVSQPKTGSDENEPEPGPLERGDMGLLETVKCADADREAVLINVGERDESLIR